VKISKNADFKAPLLRNLRINMKFFSITRPLALVYCLLSIGTAYATIERDLELNAVFTTINHTQSSHGKHALRALLAQPVADLNILEGRKAIIAHVANDAKLHNQLSTLLKAFAQQENHFERIAHPASDIEAAALKEFYFSSPYFAQWNYSPLGLELGQVAHLGNLCSSMVQHALAFAIFTWGLEEEHVCPSHPAKEHGHKHKKHDGKDPHKDKQACKKERKHDDTCKNNHHHTPATGLRALAKSPEFKYAFQLWHGIAQLQELYSIQGIVRNNMKCIKELQTQLMGVTRVIRIINHMHTVLQDHPEITTHLVHYDALENVATSTNISEKLATLLQLLNSPTFKGKPSILSRVGIILAAYKLMQEVGHELEQALAALGEIDAYASCASLLNNNQSSSARYNFAQYDTTSTTPVLKALNFWHPLVANEEITLNSIALGLHDTPRNIVITGPNACGKSTNLKTLTLCAYLAQTITLVPAKEYTQTICKEIYSSMVVSDNIQQNKSLFVAELTDAEELLTRVENLKTGEYMFIALDELFKSTHHQKGQNIAYNLLEHLHASPNIITIVSTHFEKLVELADKNSDRCANYTVDQFRLQPGVGSLDNTFDIVNKKTKSRLLQ
jgi:DNA mismatch repair ATPase MutS